jgi:predicted nucleic acid-binding protein
MRGRVLVDTGPLVAFLNRRDRLHAWARSKLAEIEPPLLTCEAVLTETCFLVRNLEGGFESVMKLVSSGAVVVPFRLDQEVGPLTRLLGRYASVPMSLADACLVRMAEQVADSAILTLDTDFRIYRRHGRQVIPTILPGA